MKKDELVRKMIDYWMVMYPDEETYIKRFTDQGIVDFNRAYATNEHAFRHYDQDPDLGYDELVILSPLFPWVWYEIYRGFRKKYDKTKRRVAKDHRKAQGFLHRRGANARKLPQYTDQKKDICPDRHFQLEPGGPCWPVEDIMAAWECLQAPGGDKQCKSMTTMTEREKNLVRELFLSVSIDASEIDTPVGPSGSGHASDLETSAGLSDDTDGGRRTGEVDEPVPPNVNVQVLSMIKTVCMETGAKNLENMVSSMSIELDSSCTSDPGRLDELVRELQSQDKSSATNVTEWIQTAMKSTKENISSVSNKIGNGVKLVFELIYQLASRALKLLLNVMLLPIRVPRWVTGTTGRFLKYLLGEKKYNKLVHFIQGGMKGAAQMSMAALNFIWKRLSPIRTIMWWILSNPILVRMLMITSKTLVKTMFHFAGKVLSQNPTFRGEVLPNMLIKCASQQHLYPDGADACAPGRRKLATLLDHVRDMSGGKTYAERLYDESDFGGDPRRLMPTRTSDYDDELEECIEVELNQIKDSANGSHRLTWNILTDPSLIMYVFGKHAMQWISSTSPVSSVLIESSIHSSIELLFANVYSFTTSWIPFTPNIWPVINTLVKLALKNLLADLQAAVKHLPEILLSYKNIKDLLDWNNMYQEFISAFISGFQEGIADEKLARVGRMARRGHAHDTKTTYDSLYGGDWKTKLFGWNAALFPSKSTDAPVPRLYPENASPSNATSNIWPRRVPRVHENTLDHVTSPSTMTNASRRDRSD